MSRAYRALILAGGTSDQISGLPSEVYYLIILPPAFGINDLAEFCQNIYGCSIPYEQIFNPKKLAPIPVTNNRRAYEVRIKQR